MADSTTYQDKEISRALRDRSDAQIIGEAEGGASLLGPSPVCQAVNGNVHEANAKEMPNGTKINLDAGAPLRNGITDGACNVVEPVAIVGMAMRLPAGIRCAEDFWDLLMNKGDGRCRVPPSRYNVDAWYGPGKPGHTGTYYGHFLDDLNLAHIDVSFWSISKHEAESMDPQQRLMLEIVYECLENAGAKDWRGTDVGCYIGNFGEDWADMDSQDAQSSHVYRLSGYDNSILSNRVSYEFDFRGPRFGEIATGGDRQS